MWWHYPCLCWALIGRSHDERRIFWVHQESVQLGVRTLFSGSTNRKQGKKRKKNMLIVRWTLGNVKENIKSDRTLCCKCLQRCRLLMYHCAAGRELWAARKIIRTFWTNPETWQRDSVSRARAASLTESWGDRYTVKDEIDKERRDSRASLCVTDLCVWWRLWTVQRRSRQVEHRRNQSRKWCRSLFSCVQQSC